MSLTYEQAAFKYNNAIKIVKERQRRGLLGVQIQNSENLCWIRYTYRHRQKLFELGDQLGIPARTLYKNHDLNKYILYLVYDKQTVTGVHRLISSHHDREATDVSILTEMLLDWESARYTKLDKPLNAYDTLHKFYPDMIDRVEPLLMKYGIDKPTKDIENRDISKLNKEIESIDYRDIQSELEEYLNKIG